MSDAAACLEHFECRNQPECIHEGLARLAMKTDRRSERIAFLERKLAATRADLLLKFEDGDDHGVADAAMDCRDIRNELKGLRFE